MLDSLHRQYRGIIEREPERYRADFLKGKEIVNNSTAIYNDKPVDFLYQGLFFSEEEYEELGNFLQEMTGILKKVVREYKVNPRFRKLFPFSPLMEELILIDPGYGVDFPMARFDIFYRENGGHLFCELNTDGSSGMNEITIIQDVMDKSLAFSEIKKDYEVRGFELFESWLEVLLRNYREFNGGIDDKPNIAIVDFTGEGMVYEFRAFQRVFRERGYNTFICDPRELEYRGGKLYFKDNQIKLIYRRATTIRLVEEAEQIRDFLSAYRDGAVCVVGGLVSQIVHNKALFAVLHQKDRLDFLTEREKEFIKRHIPYTAILDLNDGENIEKLITAKDQWLVKPIDQLAGKGVYIGRDFRPAEWKKLIEGLVDKDYIYQQFIEPPVMAMPHFAENKVSEDFGFQIGLYSYNHRLAGLYTRAGRKTVIGNISESFTIPNYICRKL